jgi:hypothetical protein
MFRRCPFPPRHRGKGDAVARVESGGGPPQSKTLALSAAAFEMREASWSAPALWRFGWAGEAGQGFESREAAAYTAVEKIHFNGAHFRPSAVR